MASKHSTARGTLSYFIRIAISVRTCLNQTVEERRLGLYVSFLSTVPTSPGVGLLAATFRYEVGTVVTTLTLRDEVDEVANTVGTVATTFRCGWIVPLTEIQ